MAAETSFLRNRRKTQNAENVKQKYQREFKDVYLGR
jgi:hypothetical protein